MSKAKNGYQKDYQDAPSAEFPSSPPAETRDKQTNRFSSLKLKSQKEINW